MSHSQSLPKKLFHSTRRFIAKYWLSLQHATQIAITGSQGKTNTSQAVLAVLSALGPTVITDINLDTIYNVPITALHVMPSTKYVLFELGVDKPGEMDIHLQIAKPSIAIITGISPVHTDAEHLGSLENLIKEKRKLIEALPAEGYAILNYDDEIVRDMAKHTKAHILWYGTDKNQCNIWAENTKVSLEGITSTFHYGKQSFTIDSYLVGKHHVYNLMAAFLVYTVIKPSDFSIYRYIEMIKTLKPLKGRMSVEKGPMATIILNDSIRANPASTLAGLTTLSEINTSGRKIALLAEMGELIDPVTEHKKIGKAIAELHIDYLISIGPLQKYVAETAVQHGMPDDHIFWVPDVHAAASVLKPLLKPQDLIYMKGSLLRHVERVLLILDGVEVGCKIIVCPFYHSCRSCSYIKKGFL